MAIRKRDIERDRRKHMARIGAIKILLNGYYKEEIDERKIGIIQEVFDTLSKR